MHHLPDIIIPHVRVNRGVLILYPHGSVTLNRRRREVGLAPSVVHGLFAVEQLQGDGVNAYRERHGEFQGRGEGESDIVRTGLENGRGVEEEDRAVDDVLRDSRDTDEEAFCLLVLTRTCHME